MRSSLDCSRTQARRPFSIDRPPDLHACHTRSASQQARGRARGVHAQGEGTAGDRRHRRRVDRGRRREGVVPAEGRTCKEIVPKIDTLNSAKPARSSYSFALI